MNNAYKISRSTQLGYSTRINQACFDPIGLECRLYKRPCQRAFGSVWLILDDWVILGFHTPVGKQDFFCVATRVTERIRASERKVTDD